MTETYKRLFVSTIEEIEARIRIEVETTARMEAEAIAEAKACEKLLNTALNLHRRGFDVEAIVRDMEMDEGLEAAFRKLVSEL